MGDLVHSCGTTLITYEDEVEEGALIEVAHKLSIVALRLGIFSVSSLFFRLRLIVLMVAAVVRHLERGRRSRKSEEKKLAKSSRRRVAWVVSSTATTKNKNKLKKHFRARKTKFQLPKITFRSFCRQAADKRGKRVATPHQKGENYAARRRNDCRPWIAADGMRADVRCPDFKSSRVE